MKRLVSLARCLLTEVGRKCGAASADIAKDLEVLTARCEHEGESFLTIALPAFCADFERSLADGRVVPRGFSSFGKNPAGIPEFLRGCLYQVFSRKDGVLLKDPSVDCIRGIRQICLFAKKLSRTCSDTRLNSAAESYEKLDRKVGRSGSPPAMLWYLYKAVASVLVMGMRLEDEDGNIPVFCRHGPGATVEGYTTNQKWSSTVWHARLEEAGLTRQFARFGREESLWGDERITERPTYVDPGDERPVKVVFVPKTLKTPRVIAIEPACMQFAQQGLKSVLVSAMAQCRFTSGHVEFRDQTINQRLALLGSRGANVATLDMKDASDRVGLHHVRAMFASAPDKFQRILWASRSTRALLPRGKTINLRKFASMGSAVTFPIEALIFYTSILASRLLRHGLSASEANILEMRRFVYVYGDDLVVPADEARAISDDLESLGFQVNARKSFWTGKFRESCGRDYYDGCDVTPTYIRQDVPTDRADASAVVSTVSTANQLWKAGWYETSLALRESLRKSTGIQLPVVPETSSALGWTEFGNFVPPKRWNRRLQRMEFLCLTAVPLWREDPLEGSDALAKCLRQIGLTWADSDPKHLVRSVRPYALALKRKWVPLHNEAV